MLGGSLPADELLEDLVHVRVLLSQSVDGLLNDLAALVLLLQDGSSLIQWNLGLELT